MAASDPSTRSDFYVYALFRDDGRVFYIGKGRGHRWACHEWDARRGAKGHKAEIIRGILARAVDVIKIKIHEGLTEAVAHKYEMALIKTIGRGDDGPLVNLTDGGEGAAGLCTTRGRKQSPEHIAKRSATHQGKKRSPEALRNMSLAHLGHQLTAAHREKLAAANAGKRMSPESIAKTAAAHRGMKRSDETRARISAGKIGKPTAMRGRKWLPEHLEKRSATRRANNALRRAMTQP